MDIGTLRIAIDARQATQASRELDGLTRQAGRAEQATTRMAKESNSAFSAMGGFIAQVAGALSVLSLAQQYIRIADSVTVLNNQLKLAMGTATGAAQAYRDLFQIAQASRVSFTELGATFAQIRRATEDTGLSYERLLVVTQAIGNAMTISGGSAASMQAALMQLSQGLASGTLRGEELNSIMEQTPRLAQAIAEGLGRTRGELRAMGEAGELSAEQVILALERQAAVLQGEVAGATLTFGQSMTVLGNSIVRFVGVVDQASGSTGFLAQVAQEASGVLDSLALAFTGTTQSTGELAKMFGGAFRVALETILVLVVNVGFVLSSMGRELGGLMAQAHAFLQLDFSRIAEIRRLMLEDANAARKAVDELTARIVESRALVASGPGAVNNPILNEDTLNREAAARRRATVTVREAIDASRALREEQERQRRDAASAQAMRDAYLRPMQDAAKAAEDRVRAMREENEALAMAEAYQISLAEAIELTTVARLQDQLVIKSNAGDTEAAAAIRREITARMEMVELLRGREMREATAEMERTQAEARERVYTDWADTWRRVSDSMVDALMDGGRGIKRWLEDLFRNTVLRPLLAPITGAMASALVGGPAMAGQGGGGTFNILSAAKSAYDAIAGGFTSLGNSVAFAADSMGAWLVNNTSGVLNRMGGSLMQSAGSLGTAASYLGGAAAGLALGSMISGQYAAFGNSNISNVAGTAIGAFFGGPIGAAIGGAIGGLVNRAFGRGPMQTTGSGITGTFSTSGADVSQYQDWHQEGGWFRSDRGGRNLSAVSSELDMFLDDALRGISAATRQYAAILGLNADAINGITQGVTISLQGLNAEQQQQAIANALTGFADALAQAYANPFIRAGETAGEALARLANSLYTVNATFDTLNQRLLETSLRGGDAASALLDAFGGAEAFVQGTTAYYQAFYTEQERVATTTRQLTAVMASMGMMLPDTRAGFRALVEAQDLMTDSGRQTYAALLNLAPAFDSIMDAADQMRETMRQLGATIGQEIQRLRGLLVSDSPQSRAALEAQFAMATAQARAGDQSALERLPGISQALEQAAMMTARSAADVARMRGWLANSMAETLTMLGLEVPQFAVGTNYVPEDTLAMIHKGEAIVPARYNPAAGGMGANVGEEMRALREEISMLRHEARATAINTDKTRRIWERVTRDGESMQTTVTT